MAIIGSSMCIERAMLLNNRAELGTIINSCNSEVTVVDGGFYVRTDPVYSFCTLYDAQIILMSISSSSLTIDSTTVTSFHVERPSSNVSTLIMTKYMELVSSTSSNDLATANLRSSQDYSSSTPDVISPSSQVLTLFLHPLSVTSVTLMHFNTFHQYLSILPSSSLQQMLSPSNSMKLFTLKILKKFCHQCQSKISLLCHP